MTQDLTHESSSKIYDNELNISSEFIEENKLFIPKELQRKGGPDNKKERIKRRNKVSKLYFEYGYSALKISEILKKNRNTINNDIQYLYNNIANDWKGYDPMDYIIILIERLESQRTRLREQLDNVEKTSEKLAIERMIHVIESKIIQTQVNICNSKNNRHRFATTWLNTWMKENNHENRFLSYNDMIKTKGKAYEKIQQILKDNY